MSTSRHAAAEASLSPASVESASGRWWQARTAREQKLLLAGACVLLAFATWKLVLAPALDTITTAHERLPSLRVDAARAGAMALDAQALRSGTPVVRDTGASLHEQLREWLQRTDLNSTVRVLPLSVDGDPARLLLQVENADAAGFIRWLAALPEIFPVTVVDATLARTIVDGRDQPGRISGTVDLQPRSIEGTP